MQLSSPSNLIELLLSPPIGLATVFNSEAFLLYGILILEQLWRSRNLVLFEGASLDFGRSLQLIKRRFQEYWEVKPVVSSNPSPQRAATWSNPKKGVIKINCDAASGCDRSYIAIVARD